MRLGPLDLKELDNDYIAIVQLKHQMPGVIHRVALRRDMVYGSFIRLGETSGVDEAAGWQYPGNIYVLSVLSKIRPKKVGEDGNKCGWAEEDITDPYGSRMGLIG